MNPAPAQADPPHEIDSPSVSAPGLEVDPRIGRDDRSGLLLAWASLVVALVAVAPLVGVMVALSTSWAARLADRAVTWLFIRRHRYGRRQSDIPAAVSMGPVHLVGASVAALMSAVVPAIVGLATVVGLAFGIEAVNGGSVQPWAPVPLAGGGVVALMLSWWGPGGASLRRGGKSLARGIPNGRLAEIVIGVLVAGVFVVLGWGFTRGWQPLWWPQSGPPGWRP